MHDAQGERAAGAAQMGSTVRGIPSRLRTRTRRPARKLVFPSAAPNFAVDSNGTVRPIPADDMPLGADHLICARHGWPTTRLNSEAQNDTEQKRAGQGMLTVTSTRERA